MASAVTSADIEAKLKEMIYNTNKNFNAGSEGSVHDQDYKNKALKISEIEGELKTDAVDNNNKNNTGNRGQGKNQIPKGRRKDTARHVQDRGMSQQWESPTGRQWGFSVAEADINPDWRSHNRQAKQEQDGKKMNKIKEKKSVQQYREQLNCESTVSISSLPVSARSVPDDTPQNQKMKKSPSAKYSSEKTKMKETDFLENETLKIDNNEEKRTGKKKKWKKRKMRGDKEGSSSENEADIKVNKQHVRSKPSSLSSQSSKDVVVSGCLNLRGVTEDVLVMLEKERIFPLKKKSLRFPRANFFCRICDYHCDEIPDCEKHMKDGRHQRKKVAAEIETELKKIPPPCDRQVHALSRVIEDVYQKFGLSDADLDYRKQLAAELELLLQKDIPGISLRLYGSSLTGFGLKSSDVNIDLIVPKSLTAPKALTTIFKIMKESGDFEQVQSDFSAKVPSVNFREKKSDLSCQITINSTLAFLSNQLLFVYSGMDQRVRKLGVALRYWAELCKVDRQAEGTIPSYCLGMMTVYYLQQCQPPVLPVITLGNGDDQKNENSAKKTWTFDYDKFKFTAEKWKTKNEESVGQLWLNLLKFYSLTYEYASDVICIKQLEVLKRAEKKWNNKRIAIEDPFSIKRNAARSVSNSRVFEYILDCLRRTYKYFGLPTGTQDSFAAISVQEKSKADSKCQPVRSPVCETEITKEDKTEKIEPVIESTEKLSLTENDIVDKMADKLLSNIIDNLTVRHCLSEEDILVLESSTPGTKTGKVSNVHSSHSACIKADEGERNSSSQSNMALDCKSSVNQSDILLEEKSSDYESESGVQTVSVSNTDNSLLMPPNPENHSDHVMPSKSNLHDASEAGISLVMPLQQSVLSSDEKEDLGTNNRKQDDNSVFTSFSEHSEKLLDLSSNSSKTGAKDVGKASGNTTVSSGTMCLLCTDNSHCSSEIRERDLGEAKISPESSDLKIDNFQLGSDTSKSGVAANLDLSCVNTPSECNTESEKESDKESEDGKEIKSSEKFAIEMLDARKMEDKQSKGEFNYVFSSGYFSDDSGPAVICSICDKEGHLKHACPEEKLPELQVLPPMTNKHLQFLTQTLKNVPRDFAPTNEDFQIRDRIRRDLEKFIQDVFPDAKLRLFGSSCNGFGFRQSDLDLCLTFSKEREIVNSIEVIEILTQKLKTHRGLYNVFPITSAKVPIVKFKHRQSQLEGDISLSNLLARHNTGLLFTYSCIDPKVRILGYAIKVFAKVCDIGDASKGSLSSYAYILLLLHYLQNCNPPVIPVLQELYAGDKKPEVIVEGVNAWYNDDIQSLPYIWPHYGRNRQSVGELWLGLFRYYTEEFSMKDYVICARQLEPLTRFEKLWNGSCLAIEDPFDLGHNLGAGLSRRMNNYILKAFINGRQIYGTPIHSVPKNFFSLEDYFFDAEQLTEGKPPTDRCCHVCSKIGHIAKECPVVLAKKLREEREKQRKRENTGRDRESQNGLPRSTRDHSSPMRSMSTPNDKQHVRGQVFVNTAARSQSDPSGRASNPVPIQKLQRNYMANQQIPALLTQTTCSPPSPARPVHQLNSPEQVSHSARNMHLATAQKPMQQMVPLAGQNLHYQMSPTLNNVQPTSAVPCGLLPTPSSPPLSHVTSHNPVNMPISPLTLQHSGWTSPRQQIPQSTAHYQSKDGPSTPPRHVYTASGHCSPVVVAQNELYRGSPSARSPKQWKH